jgi:glycosyltransferase involved in cell wall biosynthesis
VTVHWLLVAIYAAMSAVLAVNVRYLARLRRRPPVPFQSLVSVVIPARNEEWNLDRLLRSLLVQTGQAFEIIVYDDGSEDDTAGVVTRLRDPRIRLLRGTGPPPGWVGKVHALYQATRDARGDALLFLDADTVLTHPEALARIAGRFAALHQPGVLTALPRFRGAAGLLVSLVPYGLLTGLPLPIAARWGGRRMAALNGHCWMIGRGDYFAHEPHRNHPDEVLEDVRIGRFLASRGVRPSFADFQRDLEVWMYRDLREAWRGFRKNAYLLLGGHPGPFVALFSLFALTFVVGPLAWPAAFAWVMASKFVSDRLCGFRLWVSAAAPVTFAAWTVLLIDSAWSHARGRVEWKGRRVPSGTAAAVQA